MRGQHFVTVLLTVLTCADGGLLDDVFGESIVELSPNDSYVAVGSDFLLNCSFAKSYIGALDASYLYYTTEHPREHPIERVLNSRTRQLMVPNMQKVDAGVYHCYLNETSTGGEEMSLHSSAAVVVQVDDPPAPVTNVSCVSDNFQSMTCSWCPAVMPSTLTTWRLEWTVADISGDCSGSAPNRCSCRFCETKCTGGLDSSFLRYLPYTMNFTTASDFGTAQSLVVVVASTRIVKPRPVQKLAVKSLTSRSMVISWEQPDKLDWDWFEMVFRVSYESQWEEGQKVVHEMFRKTSLRLTNLHPATTYNVSVRGRPKAGHHWSESTSILKSTDEDDPSSPPTILPGSFRMVPANSRDLPRSQKVVIFWKPIPKKNRNGDIICYEISCRRTDAPSLFLPPVNITALSATVARLDSQQDYVISVQAYNSVGRSPKAILNIPKSKDMLPPPGNVVAERSEDRGIITFRWDPVAAPVSNYTFFWCQGLADVTSACWGPLHHRIIPGNVTEMHHLVTHDADVYALSANSDSGSSGMLKDWICVYDYDGLPGKPMFSFDPFVDARSVSLSWEPLLCSTKIRGRVLNYTLELWMDGVEERLKAFTLPATTTSYKFADLKPYSNYTIKMAALARIGSQTYEKQISTPESKPGKPPASLKGYMRNNHQVVLHWRKSPAPNGVITKHKVFAMVNGTEVWTMSVNASKHSVTLEVDGGVTYNFTVMAVNKMGQSPPSKPLCIKTPVRAPGQISAYHLHMDVFNSTVARVKWSSPSHPNGPINSYIVEFTLVDEGGTKIGKVWNTTRPGNETNMNVSVKCNGTKVITRVRVAAVNRDAENSVGTWSEPKNVTLCENPGHRVSWKTVYRIISGVAFLVVIVVIVLLIRKYYRKTDKRLPISAPARVRIPSESQQEEEMNDNHHYISNNNVSADDQANLIIQSVSNGSEELVDSDETSISSGGIQPYVKAGVNGVTSGTSTGSSFTDDDCINPKEHPKCSTAEPLSVGDCSGSDQLELVNEGMCLGDIPPYVQVSERRVTDGASSDDSVVESDCVSDEQRPVIQISSICDQLSADQSIIGDGSSEGIPTSICNGIAGAASGGSLDTEAESNSVDKRPELHVPKHMHAVCSVDHSNVDPVLSGKQRNCDVDGRTLAGSSADGERDESDLELNCFKVGCRKQDDSMMDSSAMSSDVTSSGGVYCLGKKRVVLTEPIGLASNINDSRTLVGSSADSELDESDSVPNYSKVGCCKQDDSMTDSSAMSSDVTSSGGVYCLGKKWVLPTEPSGTAANINVNSPPDLVTALPMNNRMGVAGIQSRHGNMESVV